MRLALTLGIGGLLFFIDSERHPFGATVKQTRKLLVVPIDRQGVVGDVEYTASEPK